MYSESPIKCSFFTISARERTERLPLTNCSKMVRVEGEMGEPNIRLLSLHLHERSFGKVVAVEFGFHDVVYGSHPLECS